MPARYSLMDDEKIAGVIRDGGKEFGLLTMSGIAGRDLLLSADRHLERELLAVPAADPTRRAVSIEADIKNTLRSRPSRPVRTPSPRFAAPRSRIEVVLLGAHLDSWDLATGGTDNGTGAIAVLEAARILKAADAKPKRTIRFVLFSGEEEGLFGSQAYVKAHSKELDNIQAVLVLDNGTGRITGMALQGPRRSARPVEVDDGAAQRPRSARRALGQQDGNRPSLVHPVRRAGVQLRPAHARLQPHASLTGRRLQPRRARAMWRRRRRSWR